MTCLCLEHLLCLLEAVMHLHFSPVYDVPLFRAPIMSSRSGDASEFLSCLYDVPSLRAPVNCVIAHSLFHSLLPTALLARWRWDVRMAELCDCSLLVPLSLAHCSFSQMEMGRTNGRTGVCTRAHGR